MDNSNGFKKFIVLWLSQGISQLGSSMTAFALVLFAFEKSGSALLVSLLSFCNYVPYIIFSMFAGTFVDRHGKKQVMLASDTVAFSHLYRKCGSRNNDGLSAAGSGRYHGHARAER